MQFFRADSRLMYSANRSFSIGVGARFDWIKYAPSISSIFDISGKNEFVTSFGFLQLNTLDKAIYPKRGMSINAEFGYIFNQTPAVTFYSEGQPVGNLDSLGIRYNNYRRAVLNIDNYFPASSKLTVFSALQTGINFNYQQNILNDFSIGGMNHIFRNQILFAGLEENTLNTPSVAALQFGMRYQLFNNLYVIGRTNGLVNNFISTNNLFQKPNFLSGHALTLAYNFALGPLEISAMYSDQAKRVRSYINLGISF